MAEVGIKVVKENFERERVPKRAFLDGSYYAAAYSGEHVAGGEFVVGAAFAAWGASPAAVLMGLILGNLFAVLSWALVCAPVAVRARMTLYYYIERLAGKQFLRYFSLLNGLIFAVLVGGMITISASALRGLTNEPQQVHWYPTSIIFVICALILGVVTVFITIRGFEGLTRFAKLCAPWLLTIFVVSGLASLPFLIHFGQEDGMAFGDLFSRYIWTGQTPDGSPSFSVWHIAAFAWGLNLPLHLGMGDLSTLRFAQKKEYGFYSAFAAYGGHFMAWVACGILGATTALMLKTSIGQLDIGGVVVPILGICGTAAVIISSITTAVPSLYRAGLAFQSIMPNRSIASVTAIVGIITTLVACSPFIFLKWLDLMAYFNIAMAPIGALIFVEHFILPRWGYVPFWRETREDRRNRPAWIVWGAGIAVAFFFILTGLLHNFFIFIPVFIVCSVLYAVLVPKDTAATGTGKTAEALYHDAYGSDEDYDIPAKHLRLFSRDSFRDNSFRLITASLAGMIAVSLMLFFPEDPTRYKTAFQTLLAILSVLYFASVIVWRKKQNHLG